MFRTKDSVRMSYSGVVIWKVADALSVAKIPGGLPFVRDRLRDKVPAGFSTM